MLKRSYHLYFSIDFKCKYKHIDMNKGRLY